MKALFVLHSFTFLSFHLHTTNVCARTSGYLKYSEVLREYYLPDYPPPPLYAPDLVYTIESWHQFHVSQTKLFQATKEEHRIQQDHVGILEKAAKENGELSVRERVDARRSLERHFSHTAPWTEIYLPLFDPIYGLKLNASIVTSSMAIKDAGYWKDFGEGYSEYFEDVELFEAEMTQRKYMQYGQLYQVSQVYNDHGYRDTPIFNPIDTSTLIKPSSGQAIEQGSSAESFDSVGVDASQELENCDHLAHGEIQSTEVYGRNNNLVYRFPSKDDPKEMVETEELTSAYLAAQEALEKYDMRHKAVAYGDLAGIYAEFEYILRYDADYLRRHWKYVAAAEKQFGFETSMSQFTRQQGLGVIVVIPETKLLVGSYFLISNEGWQVVRNNLCVGDLTLQEDDSYTNYETNDLGDVEQVPDATKDCADPSAGSIQFDESHMGGLSRFVYATEREINVQQYNESDPFFSQWYFRAPKAYRRNLAIAYEGTISFKLSVFAGEFSSLWDLNEVVDMIIIECKTCGPSMGSSSTRAGERIVYRGTTKGALRPENISRIVRSREVSENQIQSGSRIGTTATGQGSFSQKTYPKDGSYFLRQLLYSEGHMGEGISVEVELSEEAGWLVDPKSSVKEYYKPSKCQFVSILNGASDLYILGDYSKRHETVGLDDVEIKVEYTGINSGPPRECYCRDPGIFCKDPNFISS